MTLFFSFFCPVDTYLSCDFTCCLFVCSLHTVILSLTIFCFAFPHFSSHQHTLSTLISTIELLSKYFGDIYLSTFLLQQRRLCYVTTVFPRIFPAAICYLIWLFQCFSVSDTCLSYQLTPSVCFLLSGYCYCVCHQFLLWISGILHTSSLFVISGFFLCDVFESSAYSLSVFVFWGVFWAALRSTFGISYGTLHFH